MRKKREKIKSLHCVVCGVALYKDLGEGFIKPAGSVVDGDKCSLCGFWPLTKSPVASSRSLPDYFYA